MSAVLSLMMAVGCSSDDPKEANDVPQPYRIIPLTRSQMSMARHCDDFAFDLLKYMTDNGMCEGVPNHFFSPLSIANSLGMVALGAEGETQREIVRALGIDVDSIGQLGDYFKTMNKELMTVDNTSKLKIDNVFSVTNEELVSSDFARRLAEAFSAQIQHLGYKWDWCPLQLEPTTDELILVGGNQTSFMGKWAEGFKFDKVNEETFQNADGSTTTVDMMEGQMNAYGATTEVADYVRFSFGNGSFSMTVIKPKEGVAMEQVVAELTHPFWRDLCTFLEMPSNYSKYDVKMPKFDIFGTYSDSFMQSVLKRMGITRMFDKAEGQFLPLLKDAVPTHGILCHEGRLSIDETGVKAKALTFEGDIAGYISPVDEKVLVLDRPFMVVIDESSTGAIMFMGQIKDLRW